MKQIPRPAFMAAGLGACALGGALCAWLGTPLPWMIGSLLTMASLRMAGVRVEAVPGGRNAGQLVVGVSLGLYFTGPVVHEVASFWPWFVFLGFAAIALGATSALVLVAVAKVDRATAYFSSMPGGAADMATMGDRHGAAMDLVAFAHSVRMLLVVTVIPVAITLAGFSSTDEYRPITAPFDPQGLAILFAIAIAVAFVFNRIGAPTAFTMGPLFLSIALTASGVTFSSVPTPLTNAAQVLLGCSLGSRFDSRFLRNAPRFVAALVPSVCVMLLLAAGVGWLISVTSGAYLGTALLASAPGGIAEMAITAKVLRIGVAFVTAAHVVRYVIVVVFTIPMFHVLEGARRRVRR
ncbi:MAG: AbrB family transcriptional regulator [Usitatibacter sp.]